MLMNMFATVTVYALQSGKKFENSCVAGTMHSVQVKAGVPISGVILYTYPLGWDCVYSWYRAFNGGSTVQSCGNSFLP